VPILVLSPRQPLRRNMALSVQTHASELDQPSQNALSLPDLCIGSIGRTFAARKKVLSLPLTQRTSDHEAGGWRARSADASLGQG
jgi:hypothetical protein